jgi:hypothetical protein
MHQMSISEWEAGAEKAYCEYDSEESNWAVIEDFLVFVIKAGIIISVLSLVYWIHNPYGLVAGGLVCAYLVKRWLK